VPATFEEVAADELDLWRSTSTDGLARCCGRVAGRRLDNDGSIEAALEQLERQRTYAGADVQQRTACDASARDSLDEEPSRWPRALSPIALQFLAGLFARELSVDDVCEIAATRHDRSGYFCGGRSVR
jgi:hypothetical protein